jgi:hypothetical protein
MSENVGASTSRNLEGLHSLYRENIILPLPVYVLVYYRRMYFNIKSRFEGKDE